MFIPLLETLFIFASSKSSYTRDLKIATVRIAFCFTSALKNAELRLRQYRWRGLLETPNIGAVKASH